MIAEEEWRDRAACLGRATRDCDPWYPLPEDDDEGPPRWECEAAFAIRTCVRCPVRAECLTEAMTFEHAHPHHRRSGIFGGLTPRQRTLLDPKAPKLPVRMRPRRSDAEARNAYPVRETA